MRNTGFLFYKEYFKPLKFENGKPKKLNFNNDDLYSLKLNYNVAELFSTEDHFELATTYPGLLIGSGYNHEIGDQDNELKLGFFFDYTTGLPCIPGSSVKGVLRDACEKAEGKYALSIINDLSLGDRNAQKDNDKIKKSAKEFLKKYQAHFDPIDITKALSKKNPSHFINWVFNGIGIEGKNLPLKKRDIFFDAFPIDSQNENGKFLANDYITPHDNPLKNPVPIQFMKVLPQVTFQFSFRLSDEPFSKNIKLELFRQILLDLGVGAKTNVGYGQFKTNE
ncbi:MAG: type III-B CRISPR module RAMP protein Cmr6 [Ignavibacteriales bacterium]|nr:type III-B CRISPR module RAMP protein Cmr6 [Ignavibacteriales bacterium]